MILFLVWLHTWAPQGPSSGSASWLWVPQLAEQPHQWSTLADLWGLGLQKKEDGDSLKSRTCALEFGLPFSNTGTTTSQRITTVSLTRSESDYTGHSLYGPTKVGGQHVCNEYIDGRILGLQMRSNTCVSDVK